MQVGRQVVMRWPALHYGTEYKTYCPRIVISAQMKIIKQFTSTWVDLHEHFPLN
jgi:hypothetical protein